MKIVCACASVCWGRGGVAFFYFDFYGNINIEDPKNNLPINMSETHRIHAFPRDNNHTIEQSYGREHIETPLWPHEPFNFLKTILGNPGFKEITNIRIILPNQDLGFAKVSFTAPL